MTSIILRSANTSKRVVPQSSPDSDDSDADSDSISASAVIAPPPKRRRFSASQNYSNGSNFEKEGSRTPSLLYSSSNSLRLIRNGSSPRICPSPTARDSNGYGIHSYASQTQSPLFNILPTDVMRYCLSFLSPLTGRFSIQCTCKQFQDLSNHGDILNKICLGGDKDGIGGVLVLTDTRETAYKRLKRFAIAGNQEAYYMMGMIRIYCFGDVPGGSYLLKIGSSRGHVRSSYALGLILRDTQKAQAKAMFRLSAKQGYLPAWQELLSADEMKSRHGELSADQLGQYLDPICLHRLLKRHYSYDDKIRQMHTSHCWNPQCGRWAFKHVYVCGHVRKRVASGINAQVSRMKVCSSCRRAKYCSKLCHVYDWRSGRHKLECQYLRNI